MPANKEAGDGVAGGLGIVADRPVCEVFVALADRRAGTELSAVVVAVKRLTEGPLGVGFRWHEVAQLSAARRESTWEITAQGQSRPRAWCG